VREFRINIFKSIFGIDSDFRDPLDLILIRQIDEQTEKN